MAPENVEIVRRGHAAFATGGMETALPFFTQDTVVYSIPEWPDDPEYHGHDGLRKLDRQWRENFDDFGFDVRELRAQRLFPSWQSALEAAGLAE